MTKRECTDQTILERIKDHPGRRFQAGQMAEFYGVGSPAMRAALERLAGSGLIRRTGNYSKATVFWVPGPDDAQPKIAAPRAFREWRPDPVFMERVNESRSHRAAFPSKFD